MENLIKKRIDHLLDEQNELRKQIGEYTSDLYRLERKDTLPSTVQAKMLLDLDIQRCRNRKAEVDLDLNQLNNELISLKPKSDKPLETKERTTLLIIIAALANKLEIHISKHTKAAEQISRLAEEVGVIISVSTIENKLKLIPDAIERRKKVGE